MLLWTVVAHYKPTSSVSAVALPVETPPPAVTMLSTPVSDVVATSVGFQQDVVTRRGPAVKAFPVPTYFTVVATSAILYMTVLLPTLAAVQGFRRTAAAVLATAAVLLPTHVPIAVAQVPQLRAVVLEVVLLAVVVVEPAVYCCRAAARKSHRTATKCSGTAANICT